MRSLKICTVQILQVTCVTNPSDISMTYKSSSNDIG